VRELLPSPWLGMRPQDDEQILLAQASNLTPEQMAAAQAMQAEAQTNRQRGIQSINSAFGFGKPKIKKIAPPVDEELKIIVTKEAKKIKDR